MNPAYSFTPRFTPTGVGTIAQVEVNLHIDHGSPPRAWGQLLVQTPGLIIQRFTPTGVGTMSVN